MLYSCPNHDLSRKIIIQNFYAWLSHNDRSMLDTSCTGSFMKKTIEFQWDISERIKRNSKDWELNEGKKPGIKLKYDCVKSFMDTDGFQKFNTKYGLALLQDGPNASLRSETLRRNCVRCHNRKRWCKNQSKKVQNICDDRCIKHGS